MTFRRWLTAFAARGPQPDARTNSDVRDALTGEGCPVCRSTQVALRRWFFAYENDARVDPAMRERLERSGGFCAPHTRQLLDQGASASWLARWVFADVARAGDRALAADRVIGGAACPACEAADRAASDVLGELAVGLADPEARQLLAAGDGLCVTHAVAVIDRGSGVVGQTVAETLEARLGKDSVTARDLLMGADPDIARRRRIREERAGDLLAAEAAARSGRPLGEIDLILDWPCCPLCSAADLAEWRFLSWHVGAGHDEGAKPGSDIALCVRHVADLASLRYEGDPGGVALTDDGLLVPVAAVIEYVAGLWRTELAAYLRRLESGSLTLSAGRAARMIRRGVSCQLCTVKAEAVERQRRLLGLVAADPAYSTRLARAHGVCLRHGHAAGRTTGSAGLAQQWRRLLRARIGQLSYELDEAERKSAWDARWEARGSEMAAWRRAPTLLDGAVLGPFGPSPTRDHERDHDGFQHE